TIDVGDVASRIDRRDPGDRVDLTHPGGVAAGIGGVADALLDGPVDRPAEAQRDRVRLRGRRHVIVESLVAAAHLSDLATVVILVRMAGDEVLDVEGVGLRQAARGPEGDMGVVTDDDHRYSWSGDPPHLEARTVQLDL